MDIANLTELVKMVAHLGNIAGLAYADGKIGPEDLPLAFRLFDELRPALNIKYGEIPAEIKNIDIEEYRQLIEAVKVELDIPQDKVEFVIESALVLSVQAGAVVQAAIEIAKQIKAMKEVPA